MNIGNYRTVVFDCDGVVLDSNAIKTRAFHQAASPWGEEAARALAAYHQDNGGISRYAKMQYFLDEIVPNRATRARGPGVEELLASFADIVTSELRRAPVAEGIDTLRQSVDSRWLIVSGGDQDELRQVFADRGLTALFDGGIFGSPSPKDAILTREIDSGRIERPAVYLGDSTYDYHCANEAGLDFIFVSAWSEAPDWREFVATNRIPSIATLSQLLTQ